MNRVYFVLFVLAYLTGCQLTQGEEDIGDLKRTLPSAKELAFIDSLQKEGFSSIKLDTPISGYTGKGYAFYCIEMKTPFIYAPNKKDSIRSLAREIANELYSQIIEDSIIVEFRSIEMIFHVKSIGKYKKRDLTYSFEKNELELKNGFKVIENKTGKFERVLWTKMDAERERIVLKRDEEKRIKRIIERNDSIQNNQ